MKSAYPILHLLSLAIALGMIIGCDSNDRKITFSSEMTEEEQRELAARDATFEASVAAARAARAAAARARAAGSEGNSRSEHHVVLALPEARSASRVTLHGALGSRLEQEPDISYEMLDAAADPDTQLQQLHQLSSAPPDVLLVTAVAANEIGLPIETLMELGTRVIAIEHALSDCEPTLTLRLDNEAIGQEVGKFVLRSLQLKQAEQNLPSLSGRVVVIRGDETSDTCRLRQNGFADFLLAHPEVLVVHDAPGFWLRDEAAARLREAVRLQQEFDVVFAHSDRMARAARDAAQELEMHQRLLFIGIGGARGSDGGLATVQSGLLGATVQLPDLADEVSDLTLKLVRTPSWHPESPLRELPWTLITGSNLPADIGTGPATSAPAPLLPPAEAPEG